MCEHKLRELRDRVRNEWAIRKAGQEPANPSSVSGALLWLWSPDLGPRPKPLLTFSPVLASPGSFAFTGPAHRNLATHTLHL